ncbi:MAG: DUF669 domain-containing protein [Clostridia bacterium]
MANVPDRELGWDDEISNDGIYELAPEGDYDFLVMSFEHGRYTPNEKSKIPACNMAVLTLELTNCVTAQKITLKHNLYLHTKCEGLLCAFFTAIGQRKPGEEMRMNWKAVPGCRGRCKLGLRNWTSSNTGEIMQSNEIKKFYEYDTVKITPVTGYQKGTF